MAGSDASAALSKLVRRARGVVFDKDGTLVDLDARWVPFFRSFIDSIARQCDHAALAAHLDDALGVTTDRLVADGPAAVEAEHQIKARAREVVVAGGHSSAESALAVNRAASEAKFGALAPLGDVAAALGLLASSGRRIGVATSDSRRNSVVELTTLGIVEIIEALACGDDGGPVKPDPDVLLGIARGWHLDARELLFIGDSRQDLATARAAGVAFVAVSDPLVGATWLTANADASVASVAELGEVLRSSS